VPWLGAFQKKLYMFSLRFSLSTIRIAFYIFEPDILKCDEHKPACGNCIRHSVQCDFLLSHTPSSSASPASQPAQTVPDHASSFPKTGESSSLGSTPSLQMNELELLHNYRLGLLFLSIYNPTCDFNILSDPAILPFLHRFLPRKRCSAGHPRSMTESRDDDSANC
jgi:hypothetical protein